MNSILQKIYTGELVPAEQYKPMFEEHRKLLESQDKEYNDLKMQVESLGENSILESINRILDNIIECVPLDTSEVFCYGFRLGGQVMLEILNGCSKNF